jgi:hypothetical protein
MIDLTSIAQALRLGYPFSCHLVAPKTLYEADIAWTEVDSETTRVFTNSTFRLFIFMEILRQCWDMMGGVSVVPFNLLVIDRATGDPIRKRYVATLNPQGTIATVNYAESIETNEKSAA